MAIEHLHRLGNEHTLIFIGNAPFLLFLQPLEPIFILLAVCAQQSYDVEALAVDFLPFEVLAELRDERNVVYF